MSPSPCFSYFSLFFSFQQLQPTLKTRFATKSCLSCLPSWCSASITPGGLPSVHRLVPSLPSSLTPSCSTSCTAFPPPPPTCPASTSPSPPRPSSYNLCNSPFSFRSGLFPPSLLLHVSRLVLLLSVVRSVAPPFHFGRSNIPPPPPFCLHSQYTDCHSI